MSRYKIDVVPEPPTVAEWETLTTATAGRARGRAFFQPSGMGHDLQMRKQAEDLVAYRVAAVKDALGFYHMRPAGNEAYYPHRRQDLALIKTRCDQLATALLDNKTMVRVQGLFGLALMADKVFCVADAKSQMLLKLEYFVSDENIDRMAAAMGAKKSSHGDELRAMSPLHMSEYYSGFAFNFQGDNAAYHLFNRWMVMNRDEEKCSKEGVSFPPPCFPVYLEKMMQIAFSKIPPKGQAFAFQFLDHRTDEPMSMRQTTVDYDGEGQRSERFVDIKDGKMYAMSLDRHLNLSRDPITTPDEGWAFVIDSAENIYVYKHSTGKVHHSTATAGRPVVCAGMIKLEEGQVVYVTDKSGHYRPTPRHMLAALRIMNKKGVVSEETKLLLLNALTGNRLKFSASKLLALAATGEITDAGVSDALEDWSYLDDNLARFFVDVDLEDQEHQANIDRGADTVAFLTNGRTRGSLLPDAPGPRLVRPKRQRSNAIAHVPGVRGRRNAVRGPRPDL